MHTTVISDKYYQLANIGWVDAVWPVLCAAHEKFELLCEEKFPAYYSRIGLITELREDLRVYIDEQQDGSIKRSELIVVMQEYASDIKDEGYADLTAILIRFTKVTEIANSYYACRRYLCAPYDDVDNIAVEKFLSENTVVAAEVRIFSRSLKRLLADKIDKYHYVLANVEGKSLKAGYVDPLLEFLVDLPSATINLIYANLDVIQRQSQKFNSYAVQQDSVQHAWILQDVNVVRYLRNIFLYVGLRKLSELSETEQQALEKDRVAFAIATESLTRIFHPFVHLPFEERKEFREALKQIDDITNLAELQQFFRTLQASSPSVVAFFLNPDISRHLLTYAQQRTAQINRHDPENLPAHLLPAIYTTPTRPESKRTALADVTVSINLPLPTFIEFPETVDGNGDGDSSHTAIDDLLGEMGITPSESPEELQSASIGKRKHDILGELPEVLPLFPQQDELASSLSAVHSCGLMPVRKKARATVEGVTEQLQQVSFMGNAGPSAGNFGQ